LYVHANQAARVNLVSINENDDDDDDDDDNDEIMRLVCSLAGRSSAGAVQAVCNGPSMSAAQST